MKIPYVKLKKINDHIAQCDTSISSKNFANFLQYVKNSKIELEAETELYVVCSVLAEKYDQEQMFSNIFSSVCISPCFMNYVHKQLQTNIRNNDLVLNLVRLIFESKIYIKSKVQLQGA